MRTNPIRYASVCSGIEAPSAAWHPLGWHPVFFSEIEPFPSAVLAHRYPSVPNLGDMSRIDGAKYRGSVDVLIGGTPCQAFSVAGSLGNSMAVPCIRWLGDRVVKVLAASQLRSAPSPDPACESRT